MHRVLVIGCPGAGQVDASRRARRANAAAGDHYLDHHHWQPGWQYRDDEDVRARACAAIGRHRLGSSTATISGTFDLRMPRADTIVWLDYPRATCLSAGADARSSRTMAQSKPDMPEGCPEQVRLRSFFDYVWRFPGDSIGREIVAAHRRDVGGAPERASGSATIATWRPFPRAQGLA